MAVNGAGTGMVVAPPIVAYMLALIAGVLVVLNGLLLLMVGATLGIAMFDGGLAFGPIGVLLGAIIIYAAVHLNAQPTEHMGWGAAIIVLSVVSLVLVGGGFILGFILGLIGGILAIAWKT
jgi:hypothetical protein